MFVLLLPPVGGDELQGIKRGVVHGATDEFGFHAVESPHYVTDIHATVLDRLGLDPVKLDVPGRKRTVNDARASLLWFCRATSVLDSGQLGS